MEKLSKRVLKELRKIVGIVHQRELDYHLGKLEKKFEEWKNNKINCWDSNDLIHQFQDGASREIYKMYSDSREEVLLVARGITHNFLQKEEVPIEAEEVPIEAEEVPIEAMALVEDAIKYLNHLNNNEEILT